MLLSSVSALVWHALVLDGLSFDILLDLRALVNDGSVPVPSGVGLGYYVKSPAQCSRTIL
jgi:hypothetical protein